MDPLTHTLVGGVLAQTRLGRQTPLAPATLLLAANLPDVDALCYFVGSDFALAHRRGWTHGLPAVVVLPLLLTALLLAFDRWVRRRPGPPVRPRALLLAAAVGVATHPVLDWFNTYGMRWLMPFDGRWFYGDALYILDPWVWLLLGGPLFLSRPWSRPGLLLWGLLALAATVLVLFAPRPVPLGAKAVWLLTVGTLLVARATGIAGGPRRRSQALVTGALALLTAYAVLMTGASRAARPLVRESLARQGIHALEDLLVGPRLANPFAWDVVAITRERLHFGRFTWLPRPALRLEADRPRLSPALPAIAAALQDPSVRGMTTWMRLPYFEIETTERGIAVYILDARYTRRRTTGFGGAVVYLDASLHPVGQAGTEAPRAEEISTGGGRVSPPPGG